MVIQQPYSTYSAPRLTTVSYARRLTGGGRRNEAMTHEETSDVSLSGNSERSVVAHATAREMNGKYQNRHPGVGYVDSAHCTVPRNFRA